MKFFLIIIACTSIFLLFYKPSVNIEYKTRNNNFDNYAQEHINQATINKTSQDSSFDVRNETLPNSKLSIDEPKLLSFKEIMDPKQSDLIEISGIPMFFDTNLKDTDARFLINCLYYYSYSPDEPNLWKTDFTGVFSTLMGNLFHFYINGSLIGISPVKEFSGYSTGSYTLADRNNTTHVQFQICQKWN